MSFSFSFQLNASPAMDGDTPIGSAPPYNMVFCVVVGVVGVVAIAIVAVVATGRGGRSRMWR